jgi:hypothetical protein
MRFGIQLYILPGLYIADRAAKAAYAALAGLNETRKYDVSVRSDLPVLTKFHGCAVCCSQHIPATGLYSCIVKITDNPGTMRCVRCGV